MSYGFPPLSGVPANFSVLAALSNGFIPANTQITNFAGQPNNTVLAVLSAAGASGNQFNVSDNQSQQAPANATQSGVSGIFPAVGSVELQHNALESSLTFASPVVYGGA
jgi:hypothetical protein